MKIQNWVVFLKDTIDCFDDHGDPLLSQLFLLDISTGRYVHRAQGQKLDVGTSLDIGLIEAKISDAFSGTKLCPGFPIQDVVDANQTTKVVEYPWRRQVSNVCQAIFTPTVKIENGQEDTDLSTACQPCIQAWQELTCNDVPEVVKDTRDLLVKEESGDDDGDLEAHEFLDIGGALPDDYDSESSGDDGDEAYEDDDECPWDYEKPNRKKKRLDQPKGKRTSSRKRKSAKEEPEEPPIDGKTYPCDHCSKVFTRRRNLRVHKSHLKRESRQVDCKECQVEKIPSLKKLVDHVTAFHPESLHKYQNYLPDDQDKDKMKEPQQCSICDLVFNGSIYILRHRQLYHEIGDFECVECAESCLTYYDLVLHNHQKHSKATEYIKPHTEGIQVITHEDGKIENRRGTLTCTLCDKRYANDAGFLKHMRHKHSWGVLECLPCNEVCHYAKDFFAHSVRFHAQNGEVKCPTCGVGFGVDSPETYVSHYAVCDPSFKMSKQDGSCHCQYCGMQFLSKLAFGNHVKSHEGFERFKCTFCEYGSNNKTVLLDHEKTHLREKGLTNGDSTEVLYYHCDKCEKRFNSTNALRLHKKRVHEGIKRLFKCRECGAWFKSNTPLYKHRQAEHGYVPGRLGKNRRRIVNFQCK
eukprot:TCALIF_12058-PA protein Name:"Similar to Zfp37 Zinc finger protein 37 (Mus musculus)" AED:0.58 eAED:0.59 QI:0/0/0/0.5/1/1/2/0/635